MKLIDEETKENIVDMWKQLFAVTVGIFLPAVAFSALIVFVVYLLAGSSCD